MKKSAILWTVFAVVSCVLIIEHLRSFADGPFQFTPNWLTTVLAMAPWLAILAFVIRKELADAKRRAQTTAPEPAQAAQPRDRAPLADLT